MNPSFPERARWTDMNQSEWFATHVQPHESALRKWLRGRFGEDCELDDLVQEAYARLLRAPQWASLQSPRAFLFTTARNLALDRVRRRQVASDAGLVETEPPNVLDENEDVTEHAARNQERALLAEAIQSLPERCRQIFVLRKIHEVPQAEIAARLGVSECTVSAQLSIGLRKCTEYMNRRCRSREDPA